MTKKETKIDIIDKFLILILLAITFSGRNIFSELKYLLIFLFIAIPIFKLIVTKNYSILYSNINKKWLVIVLYFGFGILYSYNKISTIKYLLILVVGVVFLFLKINKEVFYKLKKFTIIVSVIFAISNIISAVIPNFIPRFFSFFVKINESIFIELAGNNYSGLAGEKAVSAFILNMGVGIVYSNIIVDGKISLKNGSTLFILLAGIFLTGKRTLTALPFLLLFMMYLVTNEKNKTKNMIKFAFLIVIGLSILMILFPSLLHVIDRFFYSDDNGRNELWANCIKMFEKNMLFGQGFGTFNDYNAALGYRMYGEIWTFEAHNIYYQLLGETGLIGLLLIVYTFLYTILITLKLLKNEIIKQNGNDKKLIYTSFYIQMLFLIYGITGNTFYYWNQLYIYIVAISILNMYLYDIKKKSIGADLNEKNNL